MGKPLFRLIPVWIAVLGRLLKTAKASRRLLPSSSSNYYEILVSKLCKQVQETPAILLKALHCGAPLGQTDSFRFLPPTSSSSRTGSHRSSRSRPSAAKLLLSNCMTHSQNTDSFRVFYHHQGLQSPCVSSSRMCAASAAGHTLKEEEDELSSRQYTTASSTLADDGSSPSQHILHAYDHQMHHIDYDVDSNAYDADNDADEYYGDDDNESVQPCQKDMASSACCMPMIMQSDDPYSDFLSSIKDMMRVTHHCQLEGLLSAYLALNARKYHSTITLAFLDALACLSSPSS